MTKTSPADEGIEAARRDAFERESTTFMRCYNCSREYRTDEMIHDCDESYFCRPCHDSLKEVRHD